MIQSAISPGSYLVLPGRRLQSRCDEITVYHLDGPSLLLSDTRVSTYSISAVETDHPYFRLINLSSPADRNKRKQHQYKSALRIGGIHPFPDS
jgi:hypothetical protein